MSHQLSLFSPADEPSPVATAAVSTGLRRIAERVPESVYLGTSSWSFPGWQGIVYDRKATRTALARHGLAAYGKHPLFRTVCIDRTYYAPIDAGEFRAYADAVPEGFRFVVKAHELVTRARVRDRFSSARNELFLDPAYAMEEVIGPCLEGLGAKAGVLLFQFPPQSVGSDFVDRLHRLVEPLPRNFLYATELRNGELLTRHYLEALADVGACHCFNVHPTMPSLPDQIARVETGRFSATVVRWMLRRNHDFEDATGVFHPFDRLVEEDCESRGAIAELCRGAVASSKPAFVIANNKAEGCAPLSVARLAEVLVGRPR